LALLEAQILNCFVIEKEDSHLVKLDPVEDISRKVEVSELLVLFDRGKKLHKTGICQVVVREVKPLEFGILFEEDHA
jgi:hypothetical protein